ncbi:hypothetical protein IEO21_04988 [Rhodonia placenta]|uniref:Uncharacterized protein n=1 Tax=Rhodonia placenta TaxID=104341 RepID=A0A8H7P2R8_9APHY|nr:hypothetical protein IEO21_04988 [Postia placenta]
MSDPTYPLFSVCALLGFVAALIPLPWHFQSWNAGTCMYIVWASLASLIEFIDSVVWNGNINNPAPVWCDISTKFLIGAGVGIPASSLCINRRLYKISCLRAATVTRDERRRAVYEDVAIGVGIPVLVMVLRNSTAGHRFNILQDIGCTPDIWNTPPAYPLVLMWPVLLGCISFIYASLTLRSFWHRRAQFNELLASSSALTTSRYFRLMLLCCVEMACTVPLGVFSIYMNNLADPIAPYVSWANAHYNFSFVEKIPALIWMGNRPFYISVQLGRWIYPGSCFLFFALFGFAEEARRNYELAFWAVARRFGFQHPSQKKAALRSLRIGTDLKKSAISSDDTLPPYTPSALVRRKGRDSLSLYLTQSVLSIDLEKGALSPASTSATLACTETPTFSELSPQQLEYAELRSICAPPTPTEIIVPSPVLPRPHTLAEREHVSIPPYHRPFTPPTIYPVASDALAQCTSIQMTIHTESTHSL